jgi:cell division protein FtsN
MSRWAGILTRMPITVKIQDQSGAGRVNATTTLEGISSKITLRDLVRTRVREEVARYNASPERTFPGLVMPEGAYPTREGFRMGQPRRIDWQQQADRAIQAFQRNGFFVLVDDRQVTELDEPLDLTADSDIRFVRLVQLVGG